MSSDPQIHAQQTTSMSVSPAIEEQKLLNSRPTKVKRSGWTSSEGEEETGRIGYLSFHCQMNLKSYLRLYKCFQKSSFGASYTSALEESRLMSSRKSFVRSASLSRHCSAMLLSLLVWSKEYQCTTSSARSELLPFLIDQRPPLQMRSDLPTRLHQISWSFIRISSTLPTSIQSS